MSKKPRAKCPLWKGPEVDGITVSLLSRFLCCRERFRLLVVEGLRPADTFNHKIEYGQMWHICEEELALTGNPCGAEWTGTLTNYARSLCKKYPAQQEQIQHWYQVCKVQFPVYVEHWHKHQGRKSRESLLQEQVFDVPYELPSGRIVRLRGKWDGVDLIGKGKRAAIYLRENKTKGQIVEEQLRRQLQFDLQTTTYTVALGEHTYPSSFTVSGKAGQIQHAELTKIKDGPVPIAGVIYNVVRRPLSGGVGSIRRHKATKAKPEETPAAFYARLSDIIREDPGCFFMRWQVELTSDDVARFRHECLDPILEDCADDYEWWNFCKRADYPDRFNYLERECRFPDHRNRHFRYPYGVYNVLAEGGASELDEYLATGSIVGLTKTKNLFPELEGAN